MITMTMFKNIVYYYAIFLLLVLVTFLVLTLIVGGLRDMWNIDIVAMIKRRGDKK